MFPETQVSKKQCKNTIALKEEFIQKYESDIQITGFSRTHGKSTSAINATEWQDEKEDFISKGKNELTKQKTTTLAT